MSRSRLSSSCSRRRAGAAADRPVPHEVDVPAAAPSWSASQEGAVVPDAVGPERGRGAVERRATDRAHRGGARLPGERGRGGVETPRRPAAGTHPPQRSSTIPPSSTWSTTSTRTRRATASTTTRSSRACVKPCATTRPSGRARPTTTPASSTRTTPTSTSGCSSAAADRSGDAFEPDRGAARRRARSTRRHRRDRRPPDGASVHPLASTSPAIHSRGGPPPPRPRRRRVQVDPDPVGQLEVTRAPCAAR